MTGAVFVAFLMNFSNFRKMGGGRRVNFVHEMSLPLFMFVFRGSFEESSMHFLSTIPFMGMKVELCESVNMFRF